MPKSRQLEFSKGGQIERAVVAHSGVSSWCCFALPAVESARETGRIDGGGAIAGDAGRVSTPLAIRHPRDSWLLCAFAQVSPAQPRRVEIQSLPKNAEVADVELNA